MNTKVTAEMTLEQMHERINLLSSEIDANEEENRIHQAEINALYKKIDAMPEVSHVALDPAGKLQEMKSGKSCGMT